MLTVAIDPNLVNLSNFTLSWHGLLQACGIGLVYLRFIAIGNQKNYPRELLIEVGFWCFLSGLIFARLFGVLDSLPTYINNPFEFFKIQQGGLTVTGGIFGALLAVYIFTKRNDLTYGVFMDILAIAAPPGYFIGRLGCLIQGDSWGVPTKTPFGMIYLHPDTDVPASFLGVPTVPISILLLVGILLIWAVLIYIDRKPHPPGRVCAIFLCLYGLERWFLGFWQGGESYWAGMHVFQIVGASLALGGLLWAMKLRKEMQYA